MTMTLDPRSQLQSGLLAYLWPRLSSLLPNQDALRVGWPDAALSHAVSTGAFSPVVNIWIGDATEARQQPTAGSARDVSGPIDPAGGQATVTTLTEVVRLQCPVTFVIMAGGMRGRPIAGAVATAIVGALGIAQDIPLPDSYETEDVVDPAQTVYGLHARLFFVGQGEVHDKNEVRDLHRYDVRYRAEHGQYIAQTQTIIQGVGITLISHIGEASLPAAASTP